MVTQPSPSGPIVASPGTVPVASSLSGAVTHGRRRGERRRQFSDFLAALLSRSAGSARLAATEEAFLVAVRRLVPVQSARMIAGALGQVSKRPHALRFPVPIPSRPEVCLEVECHPERGMDDWDRQLLRDAVRVFGLALAPRGRRGPAPTTQADPAAPVIGSSGCMQALRQLVERVAVTDFTVLVEGESGSGKELVARQIHDLSARSRGPFVAVNCAALVETLLEAELFGVEDRVATGVRARPGKFEVADRGTLFLDEVADLSAAAQAKLLRAVQELAVERVGGHDLRPVDIRLVVATNQSLRGLVEAGRFREDLYYRLAGVELRVPPLRRRRDDILELAEYFLARHHRFRRLSLSDGAAEALLSYDWPGNVRELQRVIERAVTLTPGNVVGLSDLPPALTREYAEVLYPSVARADSMRAWGSRYARLVLERCDQNKRRTCEVLGISYHTLQAYLRYRESSAS